LRGPARLGQPARHPRGGPDLRHPHLRVRRRRRGHGRGRPLAAGQPRLEARPFESGYPTVISQIARQVLGSGPAFIIVQAATLLILVLAANTSFSGFPLLARFAAGDALLPRQLRKRGHRLVYSNGILALSAAASFLIVAFQADVHALIPAHAGGGV